MTDCFALLTSLNIIGAIICPFTNIMDYWFYGIILITLEAVIWLMTQNSTYVSITTVLYGTALSTLLPLEVKYVGYLIIVFGATPAIYGLVKRKK